MDLHKSCRSCHKDCYEFYFVFLEFFNNSIRFYKFAGLKPKLETWFCRWPPRSFACRILKIEIETIWPSAIDGGAPAQNSSKGLASGSGQGVGD